MVQGLRVREGSVFYQAPNFRVRIIFAKHTNNFREFRDRYKNAKLIVVNILAHHYNIWVQLEKSKFLKQLNFEPLKTQNFEAAKLNGFTVLLGLLSLSRLGYTKYQ